jgi:transglutaminase-like putative cysteine protease
MDRREFIRSVGAAAAVLTTPRLFAHAAPPGLWRTFEVTTHVHVQNARGITRVWLPTPLAVAPYQRTLGDTYHVDNGTVSMVEREEIDLLAAAWPDSAEPILTLTCRIATMEYAVDLATPTVAPPRDFSAFSRYLRATTLGPIDELKRTAATVTRGAGTDLDRARALFDWIAADGNDVAKTQDPAGFFVSLARAAGIPARPVFGLRLENPNATRAQHPRAEVYLVGYGWVPIELGQRRRFGSWAIEWMAYNSAQDVVLPGSTRGALAYFMHPQCETGHIRVDTLNPDAFRYEITVREPA